MGDTGTTGCAFATRWSCWQHVTISSSVLAQMAEITFGDQADGLESSHLCDSAENCWPCSFIFIDSLNVLLEKEM